MSAILAAIGALLLTLSLHVPGWGVAGATILAFGLAPYQPRR